MVVGQRSIVGRIPPPSGILRNSQKIVSLGAWVGIVAALALGCGPAGAQTTGEDALRALTGAASGSSVGGVGTEAPRSGGPRPALAGPVDPMAYRLGPGDILSLEYGGKALDTKVFLVDAEGRVRVPNLGLVEVGGKTLADAR